MADILQVLTVNVFEKTPINTLDLAQAVEAIRLLTGQ
jgi:hypothetical protein